VMRTSAVFIALIENVETAWLGVVNTYASTRLLLEHSFRHCAGTILVPAAAVGDDCPRRHAPQLHDRCDLICPDLPKVL